MSLRHLQYGSSAQHYRRMNGLHYGEGNAAPRQGTHSAFLPTCFTALYLNGYNIAYILMLMMNIMQSRPIIHAPMPCAPQVFPVCLVDRVPPTPRFPPRWPQKVPDPTSSFCGGSLLQKLYPHPGSAAVTVSVRCPTPKSQRKSCTSC